MDSLRRLSVQKNAEQQALLKGRNFSLRPLGTAGHLSLSRLFAFTWQPILAFCFTLLILVPSNFRVKNESLDSILWCIGVALLLIFPTISLGVLLFGIGATKMYSKVRWSAVVYWLWWPLFRFILCVVAACVGTALGNALWYDYYYPHIQLERLQAYQNIAPEKVSGIRLQDAGIVTFNASAGVDRTRIGCLKNGATYCVAPIVQGGEVPSPVNDPNPDLPYDLFMAGTDCCDCPGEFRCGDWNKPGQLGGLRIVSGVQTSFFRLAAQDWSAGHVKSTKHAIFFTWVKEPLGAFNTMVRKGNERLYLALAAGPVAIIIAAVILNFVLGLLCESGVAGPVEAPPVPPVGLGRQMTARFHPQMYKHYTDQQEAEYGNREPNYVQF